MKSIKLIYSYELKIDVSRRPVRLSSKFAEAQSLQPGALFISHHRNAITKTEKPTK